MTVQNNSINSPIQKSLTFIANHLIETYHPEQLILFGSFAYGIPHDDSDIDLLIIKTTTATPLQRRLDVRRLVADPQRRIPFSPLVITPTE